MSQGWTTERLCLKRDIRFKKSRGACKKVTGGVEGHESERGGPMPLSKPCGYFRPNPELGM
jgi:hypothetical protein